MTNCADRNYVVVVLRPVTAVVVILVPALTSEVAALDTGQSVRIGDLAGSDEDVNSLPRLNAVPIAGRVRSRPRGLRSDLRDVAFPRPFAL